jgi:hypothetical protein
MTMGLDQQGYFWLSDPWVATLAAVVAVGLLLWCQRLLAADLPIRSDAVSVRARKVPRADRPPGRHVRSQVAAGRGRRDAGRRRAA